NPDSMINGGWLLPFGDYKGYALMLAMELLGGVLTGSLTTVDVPREPPGANGVLVLAINPEGFVGLEQLKEKNSDIIKFIKQQKQLLGQEVLIPGEPEKKSEEIRLKEGIPLPEETLEKILDISIELGINVETLINNSR
ncbi:Ldh family oxidoreductase, partial [Thermoproteota archaeon]